MKTIFVSSTFNDMQYERDAIREISMPIINSHAKKYGESVSFCDLRWGVNTTDLESDTGSKKVLDVCFNEIDRCRPYMVVILGDRYGWIPDAKIVGSIATQKNFDLQDLEMSVTALEIEYGSLSSGTDLSHTLFYFRDFKGVAPDDFTVEGQLHKQKLDELKARINRLTGGLVKHYTVSWDGEKIHGVDEFAKGLAQDITNMLEAEWIDTASTSEFIRDQTVHKSFAAENSTLFCIREPLLKQLVSDIDEQKRLVVVNGSSGSGKSVLLSRLYHEIKSKYDVLFYACGLTLMCTCAGDIIDGIVCAIENFLGKEPNTNTKENDSDAYADYVVKLYKEYNETGRHFVLILDGLEKLLPTKSRDTLKFLPSPDSIDNFSCVIGLDETFNSLMEANKSIDEDADWWRVSNIVSLHEHINDAEKRAVLKSILDSQKKELDEKLIDHILYTKKGASLFELQLIVDGLLAMNKEDFLIIKQYGNNMEAITRHQMEMVDGYPDNEEALSGFLLNTFAQTMGLAFVPEVLNYIAVSQYGLLDEDLKQLVAGYNTLDFIHYVTYMKDFFIQRYDGRYDFSHQCARRGILETLSNKSDYCRRIIDVLQKRDDNIQLQEIVYHYIPAGDIRGFASYIIKWEDRAYVRDQVSQQVADSARNLAAHILFSHCVCNGMTDLINLIDNPELWDRNQSFIYFLNHSFNKFLQENGEKYINEQILLYRTIFTTLIDLSYTDNEAETQRRRNLIDATESWGTATLSRGSDKDKEIVLSIFKSYINMEEIMARDGDPIHDYLNLASAYSLTALKIADNVSEEASQFAIELLQKEYDLKLSDRYTQQYQKKMGYYPGHPSSDYLIHRYEKVGTPQAYQMAIALIKGELAALSETSVSSTIGGELGKLVAQSNEDTKRYNFRSRAFLYDNMIGLLVKQDNDDKEDRIVECCEKIAAEMDSFLELNYEPSELLSIYYVGYRTAIKRLMDLNTERTNTLALDYCKKATSNISGVKALGNINQTILEICEFAGELYSKLGEHEDAISCYEVAERIHRINLRQNPNPENEWNLSYCCSKLAKEHLVIPETEHREKARAYCNEHIDISASLYEKSRTIEDFNLLIHARGSLASVLSKTGGLDAEREALQYRMETAKLINETRVSQSDLQRLLQLLWWEYSYIVQACVEKSNVLSLDEQIKLFENYVAALNRIIAEAPEKIQSWGINKQLKKTYQRLSDTYLDKGDFYESKKYTDLASGVIE